MELYVCYGHLRDNLSAEINNQTRERNSLSYTPRSDKCQHTSRAVFYSQR